MGRKSSVYIANLLQSCIDKKSHLSGKLLHAYTLRVGLFGDTFLSNRLIELYSKCDNRTYARNLFDKMPERNVYSWNAMLSEYCKVGDLSNAERLFSVMPERNSVSWNTVIAALVRGGCEVKALEVFDTMVLDGFVPSRFTLGSVLSACGTLLDLEYGRRCHGLAVKVGLERNVYVGNGLLNVYAKMGIVRDALRVFDDMPEHNEVTFTSMMGGLAQIERVVEALEMFRLMCRKGIRIDGVSLSSVLGVCARGGCEESSVDASDNVHGKQVHGITLKHGFESDLHVGNSLLDMYVKNGDMDSAEAVFSHLSEVSVVSWNIMINGYGLKYQSKKAMEYLCRMQFNGFEPDEVTWINMLAASAKSGDMESARLTFDNMTCPSVSSWNAILSGYFQIENYREVIKLFREMQFRNVQPDRTTLTIVLSSSAGVGLLEAGKQVHAASQKAAFNDDIYVGSGLIGMYSKCGKLDLAERIFERVTQPDIVCWNSMISGFSVHSEDEKGFTFFKRMRRNGMYPTEFSYSTILSSCAKLSSLSQGRQVHAQIAKEGFENDVVVASAAIDMYFKNGEVDEAQRYFDMMPVKNVVVWNEIIHGYAQNGLGDEAVDTYRLMIKSGEKPDEITFVAVLTGCSHSGLVDTGIEIFNSMHRDYGIEPALQHYTCIVDALSRSGRFHEAETLINKMPHKDDQIIWEVLLSSCRLHGNIRLAERAAEELFRLDNQNSTPYVLLANVYTSLGRWDDVRAVRELMNDKKISKGPGYSWIERNREMQSLNADNDLDMAQKRSVCNR